VMPLPLVVPPGATDVAPVNVEVPPAEVAPPSVVRPPVLVAPVVEDFAVLPPLAFVAPPTALVAAATVPPAGTECTPSLALSPAVDSVQAVAATRKSIEILQFTL